VIIVTIYLSLEDEIIKRARNEKIAKDTKIITNIVLWSGLSILVGIGIVSAKIISECLIIGCANKFTKIVIKKVKSKTIKDIKI
jgi:hypothetical protein